jgi:hypothetical protein
MYIQYHNYSLNKILSSTSFNFTANGIPGFEIPSIRIFRIPVFVDCKI